MEKLFIATRSDRSTSLTIIHYAYKETVRSKVKRFGDKDYLLMICKYKDSHTLLLRKGWKDFTNEYYSLLENEKEIKSKSVSSDKKKEVVKKKKGRPKTSKRK